MCVCVCLNLDGAFKEGTHFVGNVEISYGFSGNYSALLQNISRSETAPTLYQYRESLTLHAL